MHARIKNDAQRGPERKRKRGNQKFKQRQALSIMQLPFFLYEVKYINSVKLKLKISRFALRTKTVAKFLDLLSRFSVEIFSLLRVIQQIN